MAMQEHEQKFVGTSRVVAMGSVQHTLGESTVPKSPVDVEEEAKEAETKSDLQNEPKFDKTKTMLDLQKVLPNLSLVWTE